MNDKLTVAGVYFSRHEAEMAKGLLDEADIPCVIKGDDGGGMWPNLSMGMGNYRLWVEVSDLAMAKDILASVVSYDDVIIAPRKKGFWAAGLIFLMVVMVLIGGMTGKNWLQFRNPFLKLYRSISFVQNNVSCEVPAGSPRYIEVCREFYKNGATYSEAYFKDRQNHGSSILYYPDGTVKWVGNYVDGLLEGRAYEYYPNGKVHYEMHYYKDELKGNIVEYYDSGVIKVTLPYMKDLIEGVVKTYYPDGSLADESRCQNGRLLDNNGQLYTGQKDLTFKNGRPWMQSVYKNGLLDGIFKEFDQDGRIVVIETYKNNQLDGMSKDFYPNGRVMTVMVYQNDYLLELREYDPKGRLVLDKSYK